MNESAMRPPGPIGEAASRLSFARWRRTPPRSDVLVRVEDPDLRDAVDRDVVGGRRLADRLGGRGVVNAETLALFCADVCCQQRNARDAVAIDDRQTRVCPVRSAGDREALWKHALDDVPRHIAPPFRSRLSVDDRPALRSSASAVLPIFGDGAAYVRRLTGTHGGYRALPRTEVDPAAHVVDPAAARMGERGCELARFLRLGAAHWRCELRATRATSALPPGRSWHRPPNRMRAARYAGAGRRDRHQYAAARLRLRRRPRDAETRSRLRMTPRTSPTRLLVPLSSTAVLAA